MDAATHPLEADTAKQKIRDDLIREFIDGIQEKQYAEALKRERNYQLLQAAAAMAASETCGDSDGVRRVGVVIFDIRRLVDIASAILAEIERRES